jgi:hypothetical protein
MCIEAQHTHAMTTVPNTLRRQFERRLDVFFTTSVPIFALS